MQILNSADTIDKIRKNETSESDIVLTENLKYIVDDANYIRNQRIISGVPPLRLPFVNSIKQLYITGNTIQNGSPTPQQPIAVKAVGDYDSTTDKYKLTLSIGGYLTPIMLDYPLMINEMLDITGNRENKWGVVKIKDLSNLIYTASTRRMIASIPNLKKSSSARTIRMYCDTYNCLYSKEDYDKIKNYDFYSGTYNNVESVFIHDPRYTSVASFIANMGETKIYYPLETPTTEQIEVPTIKTVRGTNIIKTETEVQPENITVLY